MTDSTYKDLIARLGQAIIDAPAQMERQLALELQQKTAALAALEAQPLPNRMHIRIDGKVGRRFAHMWVTKVSYKDGDGYKINKISYNSDQSKAMEFSAGAGYAICKQLATSFRLVNVTMVKA